MDSEVYQVCIRSQHKFISGASLKNKSDQQAHLGFSSLAINLNEIPGCFSKHYIPASASTTSYNLRRSLCAQVSAVLKTRSQVRQHGS